MKIKKNSFISIHLSLHEKNTQQHVRVVSLWMSLSRVSYHFNIFQILTFVIIYVSVCDRNE